MDWLDNYLDDLSLTKSHTFPPDTHTWNPRHPSKKQMSFIQDSVVFDLQKMRMIQEARSALEDHGMSHSDIADGIGADPGSAHSPRATIITDLILETNTKDLIVTNSGKFISVGVA